MMGFVFRLLLLLLLRPKNVFQQRQGVNWNLYDDDAAGVEHRKERIGVGRK